MDKNTAFRGQTAKEASFYDGYYADGERILSGTSRLKRWLISLIPAMPNPDECNVKLLEAVGDVEGKRICELGCGSGWLTRELAKSGAYVSAIDISAEAVKMTRKATRIFTLKKVAVGQMDACNLSYSNESFDLVVGALVLHHVDVGKAAIEISRVLKRGGKGIFIEPLGHNPLSNLWRRLTPNIRTPNEWPLSYSEIAEMGKHFRVVRYVEFDLLPLLSSLVYLVTFSQKVKMKSAEFLARIEPSFFRLCSPLRRFSGEILIEFTK